MKRQMLEEIKVIEAKEAHQMQQKSQQQQPHAPVPGGGVGDEGQVLDALQELTRLAVQNSTGERSRLMLDVDSYRANRRVELQELAEAKAAEAKASGAPIKLSPMNAFERKIVHDKIQDLGLSSESEGEDPARFVVIYPA